MIEDNLSHQSFLARFEAAKPLILAGGRHALAMRMTPREAQHMLRALRHSDRFPIEEYTISVHEEGGNASFTIEYTPDA